MLERERLRELALEGLAKLLAHERRVGDLEAAVQTGLRLVALEPLQEPVHRTLMRLYAELGRRGAALRQYQACVGVLQRELRVEPEAPTRALYEEILRRRSPRTDAVAALDEIEAVSPGDGPGASPSPADSPIITLGAGDPAVPAWAEALPRDSALIGRDAEMDRLHGAIERVERGRGGIVAVLGEAGVGKSRVVAEVAAEASRHGWRVLVGRAHEAERALSLSPWVDALRAGGVGRELAIRELAPAWRAGLGRLLPEFAETRPAGAPDPDDRLLVFQSVAEVVTALAGHQPLLLVLEDLHWADEASLGLLGFVGRRLARARVLGLVTAREEDVPDALVLSEVLGDLDRHGRLERLALPPLSRAASRALVGILAPELTGESGEAVAERVWVESQGNPFVLTETLRVIREAAHTPDMPPGPVAPRVRDMIVHRLERLTDAAREVLSTAAVIGREAEVRVLQEASDLVEGEAARAVEELVRRRVLVARGERLDFAHDRIRQVALGEMLPPRRRLVHRRIGEALERVSHGALEAHSGALGRHFLGAEVWEKAASYLWQSGQTAARRSGYREAVALYEQALDATERLAEGSQRLALGVDIRFDLARALSTLGRYDRLLDRVREAEALANRLDDRRRLAWAMALSCFGLANTGQPVTAIDAGRRALALAGDLAHLALEVEASQRLGMAYLYVGELAPSTDCLRRTVRLLGSADADERLGESRAQWHRAAARGRLSLMLAEAGAFEEGLAYGRDAVRLARSTEWPLRSVSDETRLGKVYLIRGDVADAIPLLEQALARGREHDILEWVPEAASHLALAYALVGRLPEAVGLAEEAGRLAPGDTAVIRSLAEVYLPAGRLEAALDSARRAQAMARARQERGEEAKTLRLLGEIAARHDPPEVPEAELRYHEALALAEPLGFRPEVAHCHGGLGWLFRRVGRPDLAEARLATAGMLFREMGMPFWRSRLDVEADPVAGG
jgi:tetratricopeptide (TPR) repeat protein